MTLMEDTLDDVIIDPSTKISDDPSDWIVPSSLVEADALMDWWSKLAAADDAVWGQLKPGARERLVELAEQWDRAWEHFEHTLENQWALRKVVTDIMAEGLTLAQAAVLCGASRQQLARCLVPNQHVSNEEMYQRLDAERLLREGVAQREVARRTGLTLAVVHQWAKALHIEAPPQGHDQSLKARALEMAAMDVPAGEIVSRLKDELPLEAAALNKGTVHQWICRARKRGDLAPAGESYIGKVAV